MIFVTICLLRPFVFFHHQSHDSPRDMMFSRFENLSGHSWVLRFSQRFYGFPLQENPSLFPTPRFQLHDNRTISLCSILGNRGATNAICSHYPPDTALLPPASACALSFCFPGETISISSPTVNLLNHLDSWLLYLLSFSYLDPIISLL